MGGRADAHFSPFNYSMHPVGSGFCHEKSEEGGKRKGKRSYPRSTGTRRTDWATKAVGENRKGGRHGGKGSAESQALQVDREGATKSDIQIWCGLLEALPFQLALLPKLITLSVEIGEAGPSFPDRWGRLADDLLKAHQVGNIPFLQGQAFEEWRWLLDQAIPFQLALAAEVENDTIDRISTLLLAMEGKRLGYSDLIARNGLDSGAR